MRVWRERCCVRYRVGTHLRDPAELTKTKSAALLTSRACWLTKIHQFPHTIYQWPGYETRKNPGAVLRETYVCVLLYQPNRQNNPRNCSGCSHFLCHTRDGEVAEWYDRLDSPRKGLFHIIGSA